MDLLNLPGQLDNSMFRDKVTKSVLSKTCQDVTNAAILGLFISLIGWTCHNACHTGRVDNCPFLWILQPFIGYHYIYGYKLLCCTFFILSSAISVPFITPMMLTWYANSEIYLNVRFQQFHFFPIFASALQVKPPCTCASPGWCWSPHCSQAGRYNPPAISFGPISIVKSRGV